jgi:hypothetical protein
MGWTLPGGWVRATSRYNYWQIYVRFLSRSAVEENPNLVVVTTSHGGHVMFPLVSGKE